MLYSEQIKQAAKNIGFAAVGIAPVAPAESEAAYFDRWLAERKQAGMRYMENYREIRLNPEGLLPGARSLVSVALNYYPAVRRDSSLPHIAYYAYGEDYHVVMKKMLRRLWLEVGGRQGESNLKPSSELPQAEIKCGTDVRFFTDSAPLLERYWAWRAGLGWIGKNTHLVILGRGSFFFLGEILTTLEADRYDVPQKTRCGICRRCLDACPTGALTAPRQLDANRCISYLTIEHKGEIPPREAARLGNRLYGCDTCQQVCPWNRFATPTQVEAFRPNPSLLTLRKEELDTLSREEYNRIFARSAVKRAKYEGLMRTARYL